MSLITDVRAVSENAVERLAARFAGLPRPLLAAIGAGDMAVERLAELRDSLSDSVGDRVTAPSIDITDVRSAASDLGSRVSGLPSRAQKIAADVADGIEQFAAEAPAKAQGMIAQMPERLAEFQAAAQSLSPDAVKETVDAYTQLFGLIYGNLADRGDKTWTKVRSVGMRPGVVVEAATAKARPVARAAAAVPASTTARVAAAAPRGQWPSSATASRSAKAMAAPKTATAKAPSAAAVRPTAVRPTAARSAAAKLAPVTPAGPKRAARTPVVPNPVVPKPAVKRTVGKSAAKVVPTAAPKFVAARQTVRRAAGKATVMPVVETVVVNPTGPQA